MVIRIYSALSIASNPLQLIFLRRLADIVNIYALEQVEALIIRNCRMTSKGGQSTYPLKPFGILSLERYNNIKLPVALLAKEIRLIASLYLRVSKTAKSVELKEFRQALKVSQPALLYLLAFDNHIYRINPFDYLPIQLEESFVYIQARDQSLL